VTRLVFYGDGEHLPSQRHQDSPTNPEPYVPTPEIVRAVNLAMYLQRPLLLEGEAGSGKTRLAYAVAYELGLPLYTWPVRSSSKAQDGLYSYDVIHRLYDAYTRQVEVAYPDQPSVAKPSDRSALTPAQPRDPRRRQDYRTFGAVGKAFSEHDWTSIILIDEIDKADLDFPNDLLTVLDEPWAFDIPETGEHIIASSEHRPLVIITSNKEKGNLPVPFLRRCVYHYVEFPDEERLQQIVASHHEMSKMEPPAEDLTTSAIGRFLRVRADPSLFKRPGTSEFLDWYTALIAFGNRKVTSDQLLDSYPIPFPELLFKLPSDWRRYSKASLP
jgi:MoxR-like ATPase